MAGGRAVRAGAHLRHGIEAAVCDDEDAEVEAVRQRERRDREDADGGDGRLEARLVAREQRNGHKALARDGLECARVRGHPREQRREV